MTESINLYKNQIIDLHFATFSERVKIVKTNLVNNLANIGELESLRRNIFVEFIEFHLIHIYYDLLADVNKFWSILYLHNCQLLCEMLAFRAVQKCVTLADPEKC